LVCLIVNLPGALDIERTDLKVLFRPPTRPNTFLQHRPMKLGKLDDPDDVLMFVLPFMVAKEGGLKVQIFAKTKEQTSLICEKI
jgi:hypothetical protein